ncbi:hypothetical protein HK100_006327, partial [Physocladia obscura]
MAMRNLVGAHTANYGDEKYQPWMSTFTVEYPPKTGDYSKVVEQAREYTEYIKASHFSFDAAENQSTPISTTQRDFNGKFEGAVRRIPPQKSYPPIFRDEKKIK